MEGQRLGTVHIMEGTFFREIYIHIHIHIHIQIHVHIHVRVRVCLCFFLLCVAVSRRVPRVVGWLGGWVWCGVMWCEWREGR